MQDKAVAVAACFWWLMELGPMFGYYSAPSKSWVICPFVGKASVKAVFDATGLAVRYYRSKRYIGGFVGSKAIEAS